MYSPRQLVRWWPGCVVNMGDFVQPSLGESLQAFFGIDSDRPPTAAVIQLKHVENQILCFFGFSHDQSMTWTRSVKPLMLIWGDTVYSQNLTEKSDTTVITVIPSGAMSQDLCPASVLLALRHLRHGHGWENHGISLWFWLVVVHSWWRAMVHDSAWAMLTVKCFLERKC